MATVSLDPRVREDDVVVGGSRVFGDDGYPRVREDDVSREALAVEMGAGSPRR